MDKKFNKIGLILKSPLYKKNIPILKTGMFSTSGVDIK